MYRSYGFGGLQPLSIIVGLAAAYLCELPICIQVLFVGQRVRHGGRVASKYFVGPLSALAKTQPRQRIGEDLIGFSEDVPKSGGRGCLFGPRKASAGQVSF